MKAEEAYKITTDRIIYSIEFREILDQIKKVSENGSFKTTRLLSRSKRYTHKQFYSNIIEELERLGYTVEYKSAKVEQYLLHITGEDLNTKPFFENAIRISWKYLKH